MLIVEDDKYLTESLALNLREEDYELILAEEDEEGLELPRSEPPISSPVLKLNLLARWAYR